MDGFKVSGTSLMLQVRYGRERESENKRHGGEQFSHWCSSSLLNQTLIAVTTVV